MSRQTFACESRLLLDDNGQIPRVQANCFFAVHVPARQQIFSAAVWIGKGLLLSGEVQVIAECFILAVLAVPHSDRRRQILVWSGETGAFENIPNELAL